MKIAIRVDASSQIGTGHLFRCLTLANALKNLGFEIHFLCRQLDGFSPQLVTSNGHILHEIQASQKTATHLIQQNNLAHSSWLPCTQAQDFADCVDIFKELSPIDWIITDNYALDYRWEEKATFFTNNILVIDDLADRSHKCTILLDQNYYPNMEERYLGLVPFHCKNLYGPRFALLRPQFLRERQKIKKPKSILKNIFIFFGGVDPTNETAKALQAINLLKREDLQVDVVIGSANPHKDTIRKIASSMGYVRCYDNVSDMAQLMSYSDLAIGAAGTNSWERCCLGLPSIVEIIADNQRLIADGLENLSVGWNLGSAQYVDVEILFSHLNKLLNSPDTIRHCSQYALDVVDGKGTDRVIRAMCTCQPMIKKSAKTAEDNQSNTNFVTSYTNKLISKEYYSFFSPANTLIGKIVFSSSNEETQISLSLSNVLVGLNFESDLLDKGLQRFYNDHTHHSHLVFKELTFTSFENPSQNTFEKIADLSDSKSHNPFNGTSRPDLTTAIVSSSTSWINKYLYRLVAEILASGFSIRWTHNVHDLKDEDIVFYLSCEQLTPKNTLIRHKHNLVVHESALPEGRGWSPLTWQIIEGCSKIPITLFEAEEKVDSGRIYLQKTIPLHGEELVDELREKQAIFTLNLCLEFLHRYHEIIENSKEQKGRATYYPKRALKDSELNIDKSIREQFNLLRVVDNEKYPAWFIKDGQKYIIKIEKK